MISLAPAFLHFLEADQTNSTNPIHGETTSGLILAICSVLKSGYFHSGFPSQAMIDAQVVYIERVTYSIRALDAWPATAGYGALGCRAQDERTDSL